MRRIEIGKEELCNLYVIEKLSAPKIGKVCRCSNVTILSRLKEFDIRVRNRRESRRVQVVLKKRKNISKEKLYNFYITKKMSFAKVSRVFGCCDSVIRKRLEEFKIPIRTLSEAHRGQQAWNRRVDIGKDRLHDLYGTKKLSSIKVGRICGCTSVTILSRLKEFGIYVRTPGEAQEGRTKEQIRNSLRRRVPSSLEEKFQGIIDKHNLPYKYVGDGAFILGSYNPDFINTNSEKVAIEVYARYYKLKRPESIEEWKEKRSKVFKSYGWKLLFFDETEVTEENILDKLGAF